MTSKMPIKAEPFKHQKEAFEFVCKLFEITENCGDLNDKEKMYPMW